MAVTDVTNRDMNGFSKQKIPILRIRENITPRDPLLPPRAKGSAPAPDESPCLSYTGQRCSWHKCSRPPLRPLYELSTYIYPYGITLYCMTHVNKKVRILAIKWGNTMAVTDVKNRDMDGFFKQKIPILHIHTGE